MPYFCFRPDVCEVQRTKSVFQLCEGLRTPATTALPHAPTAGVGKPPMDEIARGGQPGAVLSTQPELAGADLE